MNALFRAGDVVVRVGRPSAPAGLAIELAHRLRGHGITAPMPAVADVFVDGELAATCWEPLADSGDPIDWHEVGAIVRRVHALRRPTYRWSTPCRRRPHSRGGISTR